MTGHASHFLDRLDRLEREQTELALLLYNQPKLLHETLRELHVPPDTPRIALALGDEGPHLVVARDGGFVTCLGKGMSVSNLHVVSRARFEAAASRIAEMHRRMELAKQLAGNPRDESGATVLLTNLRQKPLGVTREMALALTAFQANFSTHMFKRIKTGAETLERSEKALHTNVQKKGLLGLKFARETTAILWQIAHHNLFYSLGDRSALKRLAGTNEQFSFALVGLVATAAPVPYLPFFSRALFAFAKYGKDALHGLKKAYLEAMDMHHLFLFGGGLTAVGVRHQRLRGEVEKALVQHPFSAREEGVRGLPRLFLDVLAKTDAEHKETMQGIRADLFSGLYKEMPEGHPDLPATVADIPDHALVAWIANQDGHLSGDDLVAVSHYLTVLRMIKDASGEDLYPPSKWQSSLVEPVMTDEHAFKVFAAWRKERGAECPPPVKVEAGPGRNDPCACGSGKKFKKCCG